MSFLPFRAPLRASFRTLLRLSTCTLRLRRSAKSGARHQCATYARHPCNAFLALLSLSLTIPAPLHAQTLLIRRDLGGDLVSRIEEVENLRQSATRIEIKGSCYSSCTIYLGLPQTCVDRSAKFGFHAPSWGYSGIALPPEDFEYWTRRMAAYYPPALRDWYLKTGRSRVVGLYYLSGREIIRLGAQACS